MFPWQCLFFNWSVTLAKQIIHDHVGRFNILFVTCLRQRENERGRKGLINIINIYHKRHFYSSFLYQKKIIPKVSYYLFCRKFWFFFITNKSSFYFSIILESPSISKQINNEIISVVIFVIWLLQNILNFVILVFFSFQLLNILKSRYNHVQMSVEIENK